MQQESIKRPKAALASSSVCERECLYGHLESEQRKDGGMRGVVCGAGSVTLTGDECARSRTPCARCRPTRMAHTTQQYCAGG